MGRTNPPGSIAVAAETAARRDAFARGEEAARCCCCCACALVLSCDLVIAVALACAFALVICYATGSC